MTKATGRSPERYNSPSANQRVTIRIDWGSEYQIHCSLDEAISIAMLFGHPAVPGLKQIKGVLDDPS